MEDFGEFISNYISERDIEEHERDYDDLKRKQWDSSNNPFLYGTEWESYKHGFDQSNNNQNTNRLTDTILQDTFTNHFQWTMWNGIQENTHKIYRGGPSHSTSPSPAPFNLHERQFQGTSSERKSGCPLNTTDAFVLRKLSLLYIAFKRADGSENETIWIDDIKRSFLNDTLVQRIFSLAKKQERGAKKDSSVESSLEPLFKTPYPYISSNLRKSNNVSPKPEPFLDSFITTQMHKNDSFGICEEIWNGLNHIFPNGISFDKGQRLPQLSNSIFSEKKCWEICNSFLHMMTSFRLTFTDRFSSTAYEWVRRDNIQKDEKSQKKLSHILKALHELQAKTIRYIPYRHTGPVMISFAKYVETLYPFLDDQCQTLSVAFDKRQNDFLKSERNFLYPSMAKCFARDGYLGTNLLVYELPEAEHFTLPRTYYMEDSSLYLTEATPDATVHDLKKLSSHDRSKQYEGDALESKVAGPNPKLTNKISVYQKEFESIEKNMERFRLAQFLRKNSLTSYPSLVYTKHSTNPKGYTEYYGDKDAMDPRNDNLSLSDF